MRGGVPGGGGGIGRPYDSPGRPWARPGRPYESPGRPYESPGRPYDRPGNPGLPEAVRPVRPQRGLEVKPEPLWTGKISLDVAGTAKPGLVTVHSIKLGSEVRPVVIDRARAVQIGRHQKQFNDFRFQVPKATASLDRLLGGRPALQRALAGLVAKPDSGNANSSFRRLLPDRSPITYGQARFTGTLGPRITWIAARINPQGGFEVNRSQGVQIGAWDTQRNTFGFHVVKPELSLAHVLRNRPDLSRSLATALRYPGNQAVRRSLEASLAGAYSRLGGLVTQLRGQFHDRGGLFVTDGVALQLGKYNTRVDKVALDVRTVVLTGWGSAGKRDWGQPGKGPEPGLLRNEQGHWQRAGLTAQDARAGRTGLTAADMPSMIVPSALRSMAAVGVRTFAPGRRYLVPRIVADLSVALDAVTPFERNADLALNTSVRLKDGMFSLDTRPGRPDRRFSGDSLPVSLGTELSGPGLADTGAEAAHAIAFLVDAQTDPAAVHEGYEAADAVGGTGMSHGGQTSPPASGPQANRPAPDTTRNQEPGTGPSEAWSGLIGPAERLGSSVAVVILGSALLIAAGRRILDADILVRFARRAILREIHDGSPASAAHAMRLACALEIVVFLDLAINGGLWIDVNPATGQAAATLLIDGLPGDPDSTMRFLRA
jgi:hypothetical protein